MDDAAAFIAERLRWHLSSLKAPDLSEQGQANAIQTMAGMVARRIGHLDQDRIGDALERAFALALEKSRGWTWPTPAMIIEGLPTSGAGAPETYLRSDDNKARVERLAAGIRSRQAVAETDLFGVVAARALESGAVTQDALDDYRRQLVRQHRSVYRLDSESMLRARFGAAIEPYLGRAR